MSNRRSALYTLCLFEAFPSRGNEKYGEKNRESYISCTIPQFPPLVVNAVSQSPECVSCYMTQKVNSRNADFISIARRAIHNPRPERPSNLRTLRSIGPVHPKNPFPQPFSSTLLHNLRRQPRPFFIKLAAEPPPPPSEPSEPYAPGPLCAPISYLV